MLLEREEREREKDRDKETEKRQYARETLIGCLLYAPNLGWNPQRSIKLRKSELGTLSFLSRASILAFDKFWILALV